MQNTWEIRGGLPEFPASQQITDWLGLRIGDQVYNLPIVADGPGSVTHPNPLGNRSGQWEEAVSDIEICIIYEGKGSRNLPQNQRFIMLIAFDLRVIAKIVARRLTRRIEENSLSLSMNKTGSVRNIRFGVQFWCLHFALKTRSQPRSIQLTSVFCGHRKSLSECSST